MENKKKILICLTKFPWPLIDGTRKRIFNNVILGLKDNYDLNFLIVTYEKIDKENEFLKENKGNIVLFNFPILKFYLNAFLSLFSFEPLQVNFFYFKEVQKWLDKNKENYDLIYIHTIRLSKYFIKYNEDIRKKVFLDFNDAISMNYKEGRNFSSLFWKIVYFVEWKRLLKWERECLKYFFNFSVVSQIDKNWIIDDINLNKKNFYVISYGIDEKIFNYNWKPQGKDLVYLANLYYPPNLDGILFFIKNIWPYILEKYPGLKLKIIGGGKELLKVAFKNIEFLGFIENPYELISNSLIFINPVRYGAGVQTKLLEALAIGIPTISQKKFFEAIEIFDYPFQIDNIEDKDLWLTQIDKILNDVNLNFSENLLIFKKIIKEKFNDSKIKEQYKRCFENILNF